MGSNYITGIAFEGDSASCVNVDAIAGVSGKEDVHSCTLESGISDLISVGSEAVDEAGTLLKESLSLKKGDVAVSLPSDQILLRVLSLPTTDPEEIAGMVNLQIDKVAPFPMDSMVVGYEVLAEQDGGVIAAALAVRREIVENMGRLLKAAGIVPSRIDVNSLVWWQLIHNSGAAADGGKQVFIVFRERSSEFIVVNDGVPVLFRAFVRQEDQDDIEFMGEVCDELGYNLMSLEVEHGSFTDFSISLWHEGMLPEEVLERPRELSNGRLDLNSMDVLPGLAEGLVARSLGEGRVDLTPLDIVAHRIKLKFRTRLFKALGAVAAVWLASLAALFGSNLVQKARLQAVNRQLEAIKTEYGEVNELRRKVAAVNLYVDRSRSALECIREVSVKQPYGIDLSVFHYKKGDSLKVSGAARDVNLVYTFKKNMDTSKLFSSVDLDGPQKVRGKEVFELECAFPGGEE